MFLSLSDPQTLKVFKLSQTTVKGGEEGKLVSFVSLDGQKIVFRAKRDFKKDNFFPNEGKSICKKETLINK